MQILQKINVAALAKKYGVDYSTLLRAFKSGLVSSEEEIPSWAKTRQKKTNRKSEKISELSEKYGIPYFTIWQWIKKKHLTLPEEESRLEGVRQDVYGRFILFPANEK